VTALPVGDADRPRNRALRARLLTAGILGTALVLTIVYAGTAWLALVLGVFLALAAVEWGNLAGWGTPVRRMTYVGLTVVIAAGAWWVLPDVSSRQWLLVPVLCGWGAAFVALLRAEHGLSALPAGRWPLAAIGWAVLIPLWLCLLWLHQIDPTLLLALFGLIWVADSAAYFAGRRWGQRKLAPKVSPGKTWAGVVGAILAAPLVGGVIGALEGYGAATLTGFCMLCLLTVAASIVGDLFESLLKRQAGVKDSGTLLPGHGGVLDRVDSLTAAAPLFYWGMTLLVPRT
jgi:phosphatidate cytidylyltransferase